MKAFSKHFKRCLSMVLVLALLLACSNLSLALQPFSLKSANPVTAGELVANNYSLTDAEKELLISGLLAGGSYAYAAPADSKLVSVDAENRTLRAENYTDAHGNVWKPTTAEIIVDGETYETIDLSVSSGYTYAGNAFSILVTYVLYLAVDTDIQASLLNTAYWLQQGIANVEAVNAHSGNLAALEYGMPQLYDLAVNGYKVAGITVGVSDEVKAAVFALKAQMDANGGVLNLSKMLNDYNGTSKVGYLLTHGAALKAEMESTAGYVESVNKVLKTISGFGQLAEQGLLDRDLYDMVVKLHDMLNNLTSVMNASLAGDWTAAEKGTTLVKSAATAAEYETLDALVAGLGETVHTAADFTLAESLLAVTTAIQHNMSMKNVTVTVELLVVEDKVGSDALVSGGEAHTVVLTLAEDASKADIEAAVAESGIVTTALNGWDKYAAGHYEASCSALPETLVEDISYTITYKPKMHTITYGEGYAGAASASYSYGFQLKLPEHSDLAKVYDYYVDGVYYAQGSIYTVADDVTISRESGKPYINTDLFTVIANNFGTEKESSILTSGALLDNTEINIRYPDSDSGTLVTVEGNVLTAGTYSSDYKGKVWEPYSYTVVTGSEETVRYFDGAASVTIPELAYDSVKVVYRLVLDDFSDDVVLKKLQLPKILSDEAVGQRAALDKLSADSVYNNMGQLTRTMLGALSGLIDVTDFNENGDTTDDKELQTYFKGVVSSIIANCVDVDGSLKIYNMLTDYRSVGSGGLAYYYGNSEALINEINLISGYLSDMLADEEKVNGIKVLMSSAGYAEYVDKISELESTMGEVKDALMPPNAAIDLSSGNLGKLVSALETAGEVNSYTAIPEPGKLVLTSGEFVVTSSTKAAVKVTLEIGGKQRTVSVIYDRGYELTQADVDGIKASVDAAVAELLGENEKYYNNSYENGAALDELVGVRLSGSKNFTYAWAAKTYTVLVEGAAAQTISIEDLEIELPAAPDAGMRYDYMVDGQTVASGKYAFTPEQIDRLFASGSYKIVRKVTDVAAERLEQMMAALNSAVGTGSFELEQDSSGGYSGITANITVDGLMGMVMGLVSSGYGYIGLNHEGFIYFNDDPAVSATEVSLQSLINAILNDDTFTNRTLIDLAENGGGRLVTTTMQLGSSADALEYDLEFEIFLTSVPGQLVSAGNALAQVQDSISFRTNEGTLELQMTLSEEDFELYLAVLLMTGNVDLSDVNAVEALTAYEFLQDDLKVLLGEGVTASTYANTAAKLGRTVDMTAYEAYLDQLRNMLDPETMVSTGSGYELTMIITSEELNETLADMITDPSTLGNAKALIKESKDGGSLTIPMTAEVTNFCDRDGDGLVDTDYEAVIIDVGVLDAEAQNISRLDFTDNLAECLDTANDSAVIVLQKNIAGDLSLNGSTMLNLNGYTVTGNIHAGGATVIFDSTMDAAGCGGVDGVISGSEVTILNGVYTMDAAEYLEDGAVQDAATGMIINEVYTVAEDADGSIVINVDAGVLNSETQPSESYLRMDLGLKLFYRNFSAALLSMGTTNIYEFEIEDMIALSAEEDPLSGILSMFSTEGLAGFINELTGEMLDFASVKSAIESDTPVFICGMTTAPWVLTMSHNTADDSFAMAAAPGAETETVTITVNVAGEQEARDALAALNGKLAETVDAVVTVTLDPLESDGEGLSINGSRDTVIVTDLTHDFDYAAILGVILANANVNRDAMTAALEAYFAGNVTTGLKAELANITFDQLLTALRAMDRNVTFADMAASIGLSADVASAAELEAVYHNFLVGIGWELQEQEMVYEDQLLGGDGTFEVVINSAEKDDAAEWLPAFAGVSSGITYNTAVTIKVFGDCDHGYGAWTAVDENSHQRTCSACGSTQTGPHIYDGDTDATCNDCGYRREVESGGDPTPGPIAPDPGPEDPGPDEPDIGSAIAVEDLSGLLDAIAGAEDGTVLKLEDTITMTGHIYVDCAITIAGADALKQNGYVIYLKSAGAAISADGNLAVASDVDGYVAVRAAGSYTYTLSEIAAPKTAAPVAGSKAEKLNDVRYLFLDLDPTNGMTLSELQKSASFADLSGYVLKFTVEGNAGSGLVKTSDRLNIAAYDSAGNRMAQITYVVIVVGDTNCNGKVNTSDATIMKNINFGKEYSLEVRMAADPNFSGTLETPKVNSSDAAYIMNKWFNWIAGKYASNLK